MSPNQEYEALVVQTTEKLTDLFFGEEFKDRRYMCDATRKRLVGDLRRIVDRLERELAGQIEFIIDYYEFTTEEAEAIDHALGESIDRARA